MERQGEAPATGRSIVTTFRHHLEGLVTLI